MKKLFVLALLAPLVAFAQPAPWATAPTNAALQATSTASASAVTRLGFYAAGDVPPLTYTASNTACSINSGSGDNGSQVKSADGNCWIANFPADGRNVKEFGARGIGGASDDTAPIQAAIDSLPANGGAILFPLGTYPVSATIQVGNGSASAVSTINGVHLKGTITAPAPASFFNGGGYADVAPTAQIKWTGATGSPLISINGPMQGWGLSNLSLDGGGKANFGLSVSSGQFGDSSHLAFSGFTASAIWSTSVPPFGAQAVTDAFSNTYDHILIVTPNTGNNVRGITLAGQGGGSNTSYAVFRDVQIDLGANTSAQGVYLQNTDSDQFFQLHVFDGKFGTQPIVFDYSQAGAGQWPASVNFFGLDLGDNPTPFTTVGTPGAAARPNLVYGAGETNGTNWLPGPNLQVGLPLLVASTSLANQGAAINATKLFQPYQTGLYRVSYYILITGAGSSGSIQPSVTWYDGAQTQVAYGNAVSVGTAGGYAQGTLFIKANANNNINYQVGFNSVSGSPGYSLVLTAERLN